MRKRMTGGLVAAVAATALGAGVQPAAAAEPLAVGEAFGVRIVPHGRTMTIVFPRRARSEVAGRVVSVVCRRGNIGDIGTARVPRRRLRVRMRNYARGAESCEISVSKRARGLRDGPTWNEERIATVPLTQAAVTRLDEEVRGQFLWFPFLTGSEDGRSGFPGPDELLRELRFDGPSPYRFVALASPTDAPSGANEIGYWSDGTDHAITVTRALSGRRLFVEWLPGEELRTNAFQFL